jgi:hypothetical protein
LEVLYKYFNILGFNVSSKLTKISLNSFFNFKENNNNKYDMYIIGLQEIEMTANSILKVFIIIKNKGRNRNFNKMGRINL